ncbi:MAG: DUF2080 family transposase-associated protein, partial [Candidatus Syntrophoarchaeum sp. WYZ-LMO15]
MPAERGAFGEIALETILSDQLPPDMFGIGEKILGDKIPDATTNYIKISIDMLSMRMVEIVKERLVFTDDVEVVYEKRVTPFGTSAKVSVPKRHIGQRAY